MPKTVIRNRKCQRQATGILAAKECYNRALPDSLLVKNEQTLFELPQTLAYWVATISAVSVSREV